jgi:hypothetical protein
MTRPIKFNPRTHTIGLGHDLLASKIPERPDPPVPVDGVTFGVSAMSENSPHGGEMHPDGDEVLYLISGRARVVLFAMAKRDQFALGPRDFIPGGAILAA